MKTKLTILLISVLLLTGCGKVPKLKDGSDAVISFKDKEKVSIDNLYEEMKDTYALGTLIDLIDKHILEKEYKDKLETVKKESDVEVKRVKDMFGYDEGNYNEDFFSQYLRQFYGVNTVEALEKTLYLNLLRDLASEDYVAGILTDKEMKTYYDKEIVGDIEASHILIKPDISENASSTEKKEAEEKALKDAEDIIAELKKSKNLLEDFAKIAKEKSQDPGSKEDGGALDAFNKGAMVEEFEKAAFALKVNEMTDKPVKTEHGYHIIVKTKELKKASFEDAKEEVVEKLVKEKLSAKSGLKIDAIIALRKKYDMNIEDKELSEQYSKYMNYIINTANENDK